MDFLRQLYEQLANIWKSLNPQQRILGVVIFSGALIGLLWLSVWQTSPDYAVLFANLQPSDAGDVVEQLKATNVPYKITNGGATILVSDKRVAETRLTLAQEGIPRGGGVGYEIFDRSRLGITSFEQKVNLKRATEGELARTINQFDEVQWSRVQIVVPEHRLFTEQQRESTAAVFLNLMPGRTLGRNQVRAVQRLVANSVEGMKPQNVIILDQHANALTAAAGGGLDATELSGSQFELRSRVERHFQRKLLSMFDRIVGPNKSVVSVSVDLDFDKIERTEEKYDPDGAVVRSEERQKESTSTPAARAEGVAGISANLPTVAQPAPALIGGPQKQTSSSVTNYEISKTIARIIKSPSTIKGISVSIVVDGTYKVTEDEEGKTTREYIPRTDEEIEKYKRMVLAAVGNSTATVAEVINVPLDATIAEWDRAAAAQARERRDLYYAIGKGALSVAILVSIFLMLRYVVKRALPERVIVTESERIGARIDQVISDEAETMAEVKEMAEDRPDDLAALIKVWIKEEE